MDDDIKKLKPYLQNLKRSISELKPELQKFCASSLDDQLIQLTTEKQRLELTNSYAYVLNSLLFSYMKLVNVKDLEPIKTELNRVKDYMKRTQELNNKEKRQAQNVDIQQEKLKNNIMNSLRQKPSISTQNFVGKHTKFDDSNNDDADDEKEVIKETLTKRIIDSKRNKKMKTKKSGKVTKQ